MADLSTFFTPALIEFRQSLLKAGLGEEATSFYLGKATALVGEVVLGKLDQITSKLSEEELDNLQQLSEEEKASKIERLFLSETGQTIKQFSQEVSLDVVKKLEVKSPEQQAHEVITE